MRESEIRSGAPSVRRRMPAEWEPHEATWMAWPHQRDTWPGVFESIPRVWVEMALALREGEEVRILSRDESMDTAVRRAFDDDLAGVRLVRCATTDAWIRDYGPSFTISEHGSRRCVEAVDWTFNAWGVKYPWMLADDGVAALVASAAGVARVDGGMVLEGGSVDVDGQGTLLTTESCLLEPRRNPGWRRERIEQQLRSRLGAEAVLWLGEGIAGDDTDGHVDDLTRFVGAGRIVTAVEPAVADANHEPLRENRDRLARMRDARGQRFEIVELPMPEAVFHDQPGGGRLRSPASYANFYVANACVLVPTYRSARDRDALGILQELFPGRRAVGIDCHDLVLGLGSIHCVTQQQPALPE